MKTTTCLLAVAFAGLAVAQEPSQPLKPAPREATIQGGFPEEVTILTSEAELLAEPLRWGLGRFDQGSQEVIRQGPVGFLGLNAVILPDELSSHLTIPADTGLLVQLVTKDSPAERAGLKHGDVLAKLDDQILIAPRQLSVLVANKKEGEAVKLTYIRKGETHEVSAVVGTRESSAPEMRARVEDLRSLLGRAGGAPLRTFVRRFEIPGGGEMKIEGSAGFDASGVPAIPGAPSAPADKDVKKQLEEIRAMLEALQQKVK